VTVYRSVDVDGLEIFYRSAGPEDAPVLLLLHGFPSSSRMYEPLLSRLAGRWRLVAPDYPGFGHSSAPPPASFAYTFDNLASVVGRFTEVLGLDRYTLYLQDYGGPVGFRLARAHPGRLEALIIQNAVAHDSGLGPLWATRRAFWADRAAHEAALRENFLSLAATRARHLGTDPATERYDPDLWTDEYAFLTRPGQADIQTELFYDYRTNVAAYPLWQRWLREHQPRTLVLWGRYDASFETREVDNYRADLPAVRAHVLDGGHFLLDTCADEAAELCLDLLQK
jgi:pimeloyl-ACP methyl ester carboxylesterase